MAKKKESKVAELEATLVEKEKEFSELFNRQREPERLATLDIEINNLRNEIKELKGE